MFKMLVKLIVKLNGLCSSLLDAALQVINSLHLLFQNYYVTYKSAHAHACVKQCKYVDKYESNMSTKNASRPRRRV